METEKEVSKIPEVNVNLIRSYEQDGEVFRVLLYATYIDEVCTKVSLTVSDDTANTRYFLPLIWNDPETIKKELDESLPEVGPIDFEEFGFIRWFDRSVDTFPSFSVVNRILMQSKMMFTEEPK